MLGGILDVPTKKEAGPCVPTEHLRRQGHQERREVHAGERTGDPARTGVGAKSSP